MLPIQFAAPIKDRYGKTFQVQDHEMSEPGKPPAMRPITLGAACCSVLDVVFEGEANEGLRPKMRRVELIERIIEAENSSKPLDLLEADRDMLKERLAKHYSPFFTVYAARLLDGSHPELGGTGNKTAT